MLGRGLCAGTSLPYLPVNMDSHVPGRDEMTAANDAPQVCEEGPGQDNDLGGIPIFRGIDLPEAYRHQSYHAPTVSRETLQEWFSPARLSRYRIEPVDAWYVWNTRISKAFLEDISHVEVLLRNFIDVRLSADTGIRRWWESPSYRLGGFPRNVARAEARLRRAGLDATPDQIVASLSLDNWRFLLTPRREATVWKALTDLRNGGMPHYPGRSRRDFEENVELIRHVRNRASHQEPLISAHPDQQAEIRRLAHYVTAIDTVARNINPDAAEWIATHSRVLDAIAQRPTPQDH